MRRKHVRENICQKDIFREKEMLDSYLAGTFLIYFIIIIIIIIIINIIVIFLFIYLFFGGEGFVIIIKCICIIVPTY